MKIYEIFLFIMVVIFLGCKKETIAPINNETSSVVTIEGTVSTYKGGVPVEVSPPRGFILIHCTMISPPVVVDSSFFVCLDGTLDGSYLGKEVRATGTFDTLVVPGLPPIETKYLGLKFTSIQVVN